MIYRCPNCNQEFQCDIAGRVVCPICEKEVEVAPIPINGAPWDIKELGLFAAYVQTIKLSLSKPSYFFEGVALKSGIVRPLIFAILNSFIVAVLVAAYQLGFQTFIAGANFAVNFRDLASPFAVLSEPLAVLVGMALMLLFVPAITCVGLFLVSALYHICLMIVGGANRPFVQTFRVACYSTGPQLLQILPLAGGMIASIWQLILTIIGLKVVHRTTYGRTALAVFLPMILCCGLGILFVAMIVGGVVGTIMSSGSM